MPPAGFAGQVDKITQPVLAPFANENLTDLVLNSDGDRDPRLGDTLKFTRSNGATHSVGVIVDGMR